MNNWNCSKCTLQNVPEALACSMCGTLKTSANGWHCVHCTFHNVSSARICETCHRTQSTSPTDPSTTIGHGALRPNKALPKPPKRRMHSLSDFELNPLLDEFKERDSTITDDVESLLSGSIDEEEECLIWICSHCTFANNERLHRFHCELCDGQRVETLDGHQITKEDDGDSKQQHDDINDMQIRRGQQSRNEPVELAIDFQRNRNYGDLRDFKYALSMVVGHCHDARSTLTVLKSLKKMTSRVSANDGRYRVLDPQAHGVQTKLLGFSGSIEFLESLGFSLNRTQTLLKCTRPPPQRICDEVIKLIDDIIDKQQCASFSNDDGISGINIGTDKEIELLTDDELLSEEMECKMNLKMNSSEFTLTQLVHLVTHEKSSDEEAVKVLLLCHRCFSDSLKLLDAVRTRFFCPCPIGAATDEKALVRWCQYTQRPVQNKCVQILCQWVSHYFQSDFVRQPDLLLALHKFTESIYRCQTECNDGWYEALTALLKSAIDAAEQRVLEQTCFDAVEFELEHSNDDEEEKQNEKVGDLESLDKLLSIDYAISKKKKQRQPMSMCHRRTIHEHSAKDMAEQLTWRDYEFFESIHLREFLDKVWKSNKKETPNLQRFIRRFNRLHKWVMMCIVSVHVLNERVAILAHFIDVGSHLLEKGNFFSLMAVYGAVDCVSVSRMKFCWLRLDQKHKDTKSALSKICR